jgi:hypothetical protein
MSTTDADYSLPSIEGSVRRKEEEEQKYWGHEKNHKLIKRQINEATDDTRHHCHDSSGMHMFFVLEIVFVD